MGPLSPALQSRLRVSMELRDDSLLAGTDTAGFLLACRVSVEKSADSLMGVSSCITLLLFPWCF